MGLYRVLPGKVIYSNRQWYQGGAIVELTNEEAYVRRASLEPVEDALIPPQPEVSELLEDESL